MVMYREITREELDLLVEVVESARKVSFSQEEVDALQRAHSFFVGYHVEGDVPHHSLVVHYPERSQKIVH
jgi:hypothetical protein